MKTFPLVSPLSSDQLYRTSELSDLAPEFKSTKNLSPINEIVGQERAQQAVEFAMSMKDKGYNIYAIGRNGLGKRTMVLRYLNRHEPNGNGHTLYDWCYVINFDEARTPKVLKLPAGTGMELKKDIEKLMLRLVKALPLAFDNEMYYSRAEKLKGLLAQKQESALLGLTNEAKESSISLTITPQGSYELVAMNGEEPYTEESFAQLPKKNQDKLETAITSLESKLRVIVRKFTVWEEEYSEKQLKHDEQVAQDVLAHLTDKLKDKYSSLPAVKSYLSGMHKDVIDNLDLFLEENEEQLALSYASLDKKMPRRYQINVLVGQDTEKMPIHIEETPNYHSIFGYIENATFKGTIFSDFSLIRPGSLHKANGGVLMIDAIKVLEQPYVWDGLKRALRSRKLSLSSLEREVTLSGTISLDPEAIPLDIKIILLGDYQTYQLLQHYDPEFSELFRVTADFEDVMPRTQKSEAQYAQFISSIIHGNKMLHCDRGAIKRIIEFSSRQADDQNKLSLHSADIANLLRESNYCARAVKANMIRASHVDQALHNHELRVCRLKDNVMQSFVNGTTLISTQAHAIGQVNALSVIATSDHQFGAPNRITATTAYGEGKVFDIERKVELGGSLHSKGVMILSAYLASILGKTAKIPLTTHLTFEQSYGGVDGDSASMAELCAMASAFSQQPIRQDIAITGSMNQFGEAQPIGGVNEKIEGFFDVCAIKGRKATQGVIIPQSNVQNLMLRKDVVEAVKKGKFNIWAIEHVTQAIELLTGIPSGMNVKGSGKKASYPDNSIFGMAQARLEKLREKHSRVRKGE
ncbi:putative ATP-dependent protease La-relatedprotein [Shewanella sediminis HAW-EB3]|uniref:endopeptidase La n=1 Tax=Shewanella sediminis (strain HAW-EB3) TaxID=425104 RepID=A8FVB6_SHESH|nr:ATP-binding protein [Shewanella sediminis]ABV36789.1 putative ATP-dependent protease La-relatedprotein [Shewanella sediminis HAW-EB3]